MVAAFAELDSVIPKPEPPVAAPPAGPSMTVQIPRANGFSLTTGISTLSCQVNGMDLDYSGPRKSVDSSAPTAGISSQGSNSRAQLR